MRSRGHRLAGLRAFFNDSYEVDDATGESDWTSGFFEEFQKRRGYDLRRHLPALLENRLVARCRSCARRLSTDDCGSAERRVHDRVARLGEAARGAIVRNQAHGAPGNLLDLYAISEIPETEGTEIPRAKWATSAAHVAGRRLVSAETATWLGEHFRSTLADVRVAIDRFFVAGVNHIVYHGTAYSPPGEPWPGGCSTRRSNSIRATLVAGLWRAQSVRRARAIVPSGRRARSRRARLLPVLRRAHGSRAVAPATFRRGEPAG